MPSSSESCEPNLAVLIEDLMKLGWHPGARLSSDGCSRGRREMRSLSSSLAWAQRLSNPIPCAPVNGGDWKETALQCGGGKSRFSMTEGSMTAQLSACSRSSALLLANLLTMLLMTRAHPVHSSRDFDGGKFSHSGLLRFTGWDSKAIFRFIVISFSTAAFTDQIFITALHKFEGIWDIAVWFARTYSVTRMRPLVMEQLIFVHW